MTIGKSTLWLNSIIDVDKAVIECIDRVWPTVVSRLSQTELEDTITERLVDLLRKDRAICKHGFISIHFKLRQEDAIGDYTTKGILDMALFLDQDHERYIAYECKRLNRVNTEGKRAGSLAGPYVEEGVVRYVTAKYSEKLPYGCMLGYVMDGDIEFAVKQLKTALTERKVLIQLETKKILISQNPFPEFETIHNRASINKPITVRHRLLSMV